MSVRFGRRGFVVGAGGAMLAIPLLESLWPHSARGQPVAAPKRLVIVAHGNGRLVGNRADTDWWSPGATTASLPALGTAPSRMLAALAPVRDEIVTIDGVDNLVRVASNMADNHIPALVSVLSCRPQAGEEWRPIGPSLDYVAGLRLRSSPAMRPSIVLPGSATGYDTSRPWQALHFFGPDGTDPTLVSGNPADAVEEIFGPPMPTMPPPTPAPPTLRERMSRRRGSMLGSVAASLSALRSRVSTVDRERLDRHAAFLESVEARFAGGGPVVRAMSCLRPDEASIVRVPSDRAAEWERGRNDAATWPFQMENAVQALACDAVRVIGISLHDDPVFKAEFSSTSPFEGDDEVHETVHGMQEATASADHGTADELRIGFQQYARQFAQLVQRLAEVEDVDGSRLLDNTLVLWVSEMGYGSDHLVSNLPIVLAGMRSAFSKGQGRHVVENRRTMGNLCSQILRMLGGTDETYGETGTIGELCSARGVGDPDWDRTYPGTDRNTPLHMGPLDL